ncbi:hypothetical protein THAOC_11923 [Thalassiosira oceanica]|uniref:Uncharacterized protein n=1 Tax=Thalassiosira oceanica TaxID=159749 RepID=K0T982_THAOC|nr:hypothetical protein THAOC_11923 [Thalassiosira oceanica]|eukprot:EJK67092.1 hypothetical protein THAOC_11923 [Thalassiosira oceanica]
MGSWHHIPAGFEVLTDHNGQASRIQQSSALHPTRGLGFLFTLDGNQLPEYEYRTEQLAQILHRLSVSSLRNEDANQSYMLRSRVLPSVTYPISLTSFSKKQCKELTKMIKHTILPKMGINACISRPVLYGPTILGGMNYPCIQTFQDRLGIMNIMKHLRHDSEIGTEIQALVSAHQLHSRAILPLLDDPSIDLLHMENGWIKSIRDSLRRLGGQLWIEDAYWAPKRQRVGDVSLMEAFCKLPGITPTEDGLYLTCRCYVRDELSFHCYEHTPPPPPPSPSAYDKDDFDMNDYEPRFVRIKDNVSSLPTAAHPTEIDIHDDRAVPLYDYVPPMQPAWQETARPFYSEHILPIMASTEVLTAVESAIDLLNNPADPTPEVLTKAEGDLLTAITRSLRSFPNISLKHVHGHQLRTTAYENLTFEAQLNEDCDVAAKQAMRTDVLTSSRPEPTDGSRAQLYLGNLMVSTDYQTAITHAAHYPALRERMMEKFDWTASDFDKINFDAIESVKLRLPYMKSLQISKMLHNYSNTGSQREKYGYEGGCPYACFIDRESPTDGRNSPPQTHPQYSRPSLHALGPRDMQPPYQRVRCPLCTLRPGLRGPSQSRHRSYIAGLPCQGVKEWTPAIAKRPPPVPANNPSGTHAPHPSHLCTVLLSMSSGIFGLLFGPPGTISSLIKTTESPAPKTPETQHAFYISRNIILPPSDNATGIRLPSQQPHSPLGGAARGKTSDDHSNDYIDCTWTNNDSQPKGNVL